MSIKVRVSGLRSKTLKGVMKFTVWDDTGTGVRGMMEDSVDMMRCEEVEMLEQQKSSVEDGEQP